ncbi:head GIN domain-containing protein [Rugamonas sp. CCM 8940]|uniref:head GIN domain-containing protein n=1 Tax=Rugamonas sp. CCM 8940 TaxID=2765359 RepID=UPI0018F7648F|nr:head GIN domain-containing protein [Rugamonas sp. CCM 8940]MBJ7313143.1 DUF2807 domain-containing protein [Rugamonas sp. CCM 8940]
MQRTPSLRHHLRHLLLAASALAVAAPLTLGTAQASPLDWLRGETVKGSGKMISQTRELGHFNAMALSTGGNVEIRLGNSESVTIEADDNILPLIETVVENGTLRIRPLQKAQHLDIRNLKLVVQARSLERVSMAGSGTINADRLQGEKLQFDVGGSGSINVAKLNSEAVTISIGGSGSMKAGGNTERLQVSIGGSGTVHTGQLAVRDAVINIGGSGQATVSAQKSLSLSVAGSGSIGYYGDP